MKFFYDDEKLYRAIFPPEVRQFYWKKNGQISSAAFKDKNGLSVERGNYRDDKLVIEDMRKWFVGMIVYWNVAVCRDVGAIVRYKPTTRSIFHTEIHSGENRVLLTASQARAIAKRVKVI